MSLKSIDPTQTLAWKKLQAHFETIKDVHMSSLFSKNSKRSSEMSLEWDDFFLDYSKNRITAQTISLLKGLAEEIQLSDAISKYFEGEKINKTGSNIDLLMDVVAPSKTNIEGVFVSGDAAGIS